jgi:hypothetical protein
MSETKVSKPTMIANLPEVLEITGKFVYNFFKSDERVVEDSSYYGNTGFYASTAPLTTAATMGMGGLSIDEAAQAAQNDFINVSNITDSGLLKYFSKSTTYPRFNVIEIVPPNDIDEIALTDEQVTNVKSRLLYENTSKLFNRIGVSITNTEIDASVAATLSSQQNTGLIDNSSQSNEQDTIIKTLLSPAQSGYNYANSQDESMTSKIANIFLGVSFNSSITPFVAKELFEGSLLSYKNIHAEELVAAKEQVTTIQSTAISRNSPYSIRMSDYEAVLPSIDTRELSGPEILENQLTNKLAGFIVEKYGLSDDGTIKIFETKIYPSAKYTTFIDPNIAYGRSYRYRVKCLYVCEFEATLSNENGDVGLYEIVTPFVSGGRDVVVNCIELIAPQPPVDLRFRFRGKDQGLMVTWNFPLNLTLDIKKFHVYRRANIAEPFQLLKVFDFDDSVIQTQDPENIPRGLIERSMLPTTLYRDFDFDRDSRFIYSIVAVDAHGMSSNYSVQLEASYDKYRNRINSRVISRSGAPRPYPNIYLNVDTFVDTMKLSGYKKLNIFFDPDFSKVQVTERLPFGSDPFSTTSETTVDLSHILYSNDSTDNNSYKLMIVNTDMQNSQTVTIKINDGYISPSTLVGTEALVFAGSESSATRSGRSRRSSSSGIFR